MSSRDVIPVPMTGKMDREESERIRENLRESSERNAQRMAREQSFGSGCHLNHMLNFHGHVVSSSLGNNGV